MNETLLDRGQVAVRVRRGESEPWQRAYQRAVDSLMDTVRGRGAAGLTAVSIAGMTGDYLEVTAHPVYDSSYTPREQT